MNQRAMEDLLKEGEELEAHDSDSYQTLLDRAGRASGWATRVADVVARTKAPLEEDRPDYDAVEKLVTDAGFLNMRSSEVNQLAATLAVANDWIRIARPFLPPEHQRNLPEETKGPGKLPQPVQPIGPPTLEQLQEIVDMIPTIAVKASPAAPAIVSSPVARPPLGERPS